MVTYQERFQVWCLEKRKGLEDRGFEVTVESCEKNAADAICWLTAYCDLMPFTIHIWDDGLIDITAIEGSTLKTIFLKDIEKGSFEQKLDGYLSQILEEFQKLKET